MRKLVVVLGAALVLTAAAQDAWVFEENIVGGVNRSFIGGTSEAGDAILYVRCNPESVLGIEWFLYVGQALGTADAYVVTYSVGDGRVIPSRWPASDDRTAVFGEDWEFDIVAMAVRFNDAETLTVTVAADWGEPMFTFDLGGLDEALDALGCFA